MPTEKLSADEQRLNHIVMITTYFQLTAILTVGLLFYFQPYHYREIGKGIAILAFLVSCALSRWYVHTGKQFETSNTFSPKERQARKKEYFTWFFPSYFLWSGCTALFSYL